MFSKHTCIHLCSYVYIDWEVSRALSFCVICDVLILFKYRCDEYNTYYVYIRIVISEMLNARRVTYSITVVAGTISLWIKNN